MNFHKKQKHMIEAIFPITLFFIFALSALIVLVLAAHVYQTTTQNSSANHTSQIALSYVSEKIHQTDVDGQVTIEHIEGEDALVITQMFDQSLYKTYIYMWNGELKELFVRQDTSFRLADGTTILKIKDFSMTKLNNKLYQFTCTDTNDYVASIKIAVRSE